LRSEALIAAEKVKASGFMRELIISSKKKSASSPLEVEGNCDARDIAAL